MKSELYDRSVQRDELATHTGVPAKSSRTYQYVMWAIALMRVGSDTLKWVLDPGNVQSLDS
jgi:hypothetical protein